MPRSRRNEIEALEQQVQTLLEDFKRAQADNVSLKAREKALVTQISQAAGGVHAIKQSLVSSAAKLAAAATGADNRLLDKLHEKEQRVQEVLAYLGLARAASADGYEELYTTKMLHKLAANPAKQQELLNSTKEQAMQKIATVAQRCGMLVTRYDCPKLPTGYSPREELDGIIDNCIQATLFRGFLEPLHNKQRRNTAFMGINMITGQMEPYPAGWFRQVAQAMCAAPEQRAIVVAAWLKAKSDLANLMQRHEALAQQLVTLQQAQAADCRDFTQQAEALTEKVAHSAMQLMQKRSLRAVVTGASINQQQEKDAQQGSSLNRGLSLSPSGVSSNSDSSAAQLVSLSLEEEAQTYSVSDRQKRIEAEMDSILVQMNLMAPALAMVSYNTFCRKQLALGLVNAYPFVPDTFAIFEAFREMHEEKAGK